MRTRTLGRPSESRDQPVKVSRFTLRLTVLTLCARFPQDRAAHLGRPAAIAGVPEAVREAVLRCRIRAVAFCGGSHVVEALRRIEPRPWCKSLGVCHCLGAPMIRDQFGVGRPGAADAGEPRAREKARASSALLERHGPDARPRRR